MKILWLGTSDDTMKNPGVDEPAHLMVQRRLSEALGEPVEIVAKPAWPSERFAPAVGRWMEREQPDIVYLKVTAFWYGFESVLLRIERVLGRFAKPVTKTANFAGKGGPFFNNAAVRAARRGLHVVIKPASPFTVEEVAQSVGEAVRVAARREHTLIIVRGPRTWSTYPISNASRRRGLAKRERLLALLRPQLEAAHALYVDARVGTPEHHATTGRDGLHMDAAAQEDSAEEVFDDILREWTRLRTPAS